jgi:hypothetical protein
MQTAQIRSRKLLADGAGHTFRYTGPVHAPSKADGPLSEQSSISLAFMPPEPPVAFRDFRDRLQRAGKAPKAAIIATARKLLVTLSAMVATRQRYAVQPLG